MSGKQKGSSFERETCKQLSEWWSDGERQDIFWRTDNSGGRAKIRTKKGKTTFGNYGDVKAVDPVGLPLTNTATFELKSGYKQWSFLDCLDHPRKQWNQKRRSRQVFEQFAFQVEEDAKTANTYPVIIAKRDKRQKSIVLPEELFWLIEEDCGKFEHFTIRTGTNEFIHRNFIVIRFDKFLNWCSPSFFIDRKEKENGNKVHTRRRPSRRKKNKSKTSDSK